MWNDCMLNLMASICMVIFTKWHGQLVSERFTASSILQLKNNMFVIMVAIRFSLQNGSGKFDLRS